MIQIPPIFGKNKAEPPWDSLEPIRAELFNVERLEQHAKTLADAQPVTFAPQKHRPIARRLEDNAAALLGDYRMLGRAVAAGRPITPAAEWLIDNFHIVEEQIRQIREDLPPGYYSELPKLAEGPFVRYPRVLGIAWAYVAHTDSLFDPGVLERFVSAYQTVQQLTIGELWAIAITLRIVLVENLRRLADRIVRARKERELADELADFLLALDAKKEHDLGAILALREKLPISNTFAVQLTQRLRDWDQDSIAVTQWLNRQLELHGMTIERAVAEEHQRQTAANVTVRNIFTSMRLISDVDWMDWFESVSLIDKSLRTCRGYSAMDFPTRNLYRTAIEELSRGSELSEYEIAQRVLDSSQCIEAASLYDAAPASDPGHYLIGDGRLDFERSISFRPTLLASIRSLIRSAGMAGYVNAVGVLTLLLVALLVWLIAGVSAPATAIILCLAVIFPASEVAVATINYTITKLLGARLLPSLELQGGVPEELRTVVVVPALLTSHQSVEELIDRLEVHYLSDSDGHLSFGLLTDWTDALEEETPSDWPLLKAALEGIYRLNGRHDPTGRQQRFFLLHRRRLWNEREGRWIGWERKRGKLHELNRLLRGEPDTTFIVIGGRLPERARYVITLDADTRMPREMARKLIGKMAHPLNRPQLDADSCRIVAGHGVLQPRVTPSLSDGHERSLYQKVFSTPRGLDPYVFAVSDVYQDLFDEGSFAGKGIYDIDAFETALDSRIPQNSLLSHDLFEGIFCRSGFASDVEVIEDFPTRYEVAALRQHRWVRGDWQLLPWILNSRRTGKGQQADAIPLLGRWKMFDNLRRSLVAPTILLSLLAGVLLLDLSHAVAWCAVLLGFIAYPSLLPLIESVMPRQEGITPGSHLRTFLTDTVLALAQAAMSIVFLGHQAWLMGDAIARTLYRLLISKHSLLEWTTAAQLQTAVERNLAGYSRHMAGSFAAAVAIMLAGYFGRYHLIAVAVPFALAWIAAPAIAQWVSRGFQSEGWTRDLTVDSAQALRLTARRTWKYFENFVTAADNMLPPDNFQEEPRPVIAQRTSPTNIGLYLLCVVAARDFGWAGLHETVERLEATFATLRKLETFRGHFLNWYATADLRSLEPRYVSTVDSGNLCAHLIAVANSCRAWIEEPGISQALFDGIVDNLLLVREAMKSNSDDRRALKGMRRQINDDAEALLKSIATVRLTPELASVRLIELSLQAARLNEITDIYTKEIKTEEGIDLLNWTKAVHTAIESHFRDVTAGAEEMRVLRRRLSALEKESRDMAHTMDFSFLFNDQRYLFAIGYRVGDGTLDSNCYDLLASEARLASFIAIAKGDVRTKHWFKLDRSVTAIEFGAALLSWSGSMFEYLMPLIVMRTPPGGLLSQTCELAVRKQVDYGNSKGVPWGISESAFNARDVEFTYQYSNFGVPGLGLKRGLADNLVIAPYATGLAAMVAPNEAVHNLERLTREGALGKYGYYEALDYTPSRVPDGKSVAIVRSYMAHHQGMMICAIANALKDWLFCNRFHHEPMVKATELLLQERAPRGVPVTHGPAEAIEYTTTVLDHMPSMMRKIGTVHTAVPATHLLSNGSYTVMVTAAGSGYSTWRGQAITRWREDTTRDNCGTYIYLRDVESGNIWSAGYQPTTVESEDYLTIFAEDRAEIVRRDGTLNVTLECVVSPEDDAEVRRVTLSNSSRQRRDVEVTSYAELVLAPAAADSAHPAFSKMFVETEYIPDSQTIIARRRRRSPTDPEMWVAHLLVVEGRTIGKPEADSDRMAFLGRGNDVRTPAAIAGKPLSGTFGAVLDPIVALRQRVRVPAGGVARCAFWTLAADTRDKLIDLIDRHRHAAAFDRAAMLAWTQAQIQLRHLSVEAEEAGLYQQLASHLLYANGQLRPSSGLLVRGLASQAALWPLGISGDRPIVLVRIDDAEDAHIIRQLLRAQEYWRMKQLFADLVILNERASSYAQDLQGTIETFVRTARARSAPVEGGKSGEVYILRSDLISPQAASVLPAVARVVLAGRRGTLADQLNRIREPRTSEPPKVRPRSFPKSQAGTSSPEGLEFYNGYGGFDAKGAEFVTVIDEGKLTPMPWINVVANEQFGFHAAAEGGGYTWAINSRDLQISAWPNDPVSNPPGEAIYIRDEATGNLFSPTYLPVRDSMGPYTARFGAGYCRFQHRAHGIELDLMQFVPLAESVKVSRLTLRNLTRSPRQLSITAYVEWVLASTRGSSAPFIITSIDPESGALFARNPWNVHFGSRVAFLDIAGKQESYTGDRREFLGRHGTPEMPAALVKGANLSNGTGAGHDPCGALQTLVDIEANGTAEVVVFFGEAANEASAAELVRRIRSSNLDELFEEVRHHWDSMLGAVEVATPDRALDILVNRWLLYQTLACRIWARSGYYQASGAFGFRDQLQDTMALLHSRADICRRHILNASARQFREGDVQHWWLPSNGMGIRTHISDDAVWLAYAVAHYVETTGDKTILDEKVPFLEGQTIGPGQADAFFQPEVSEENASIFEHCVRALNKSLSKGPHGLPLIGTGDWNDGMNAVGFQGKGESVWLGWFLYATLNSFSAIAEQRGELGACRTWRHFAADLKKALAESAWDGKWYRRAYFDDGTPLGSAENPECKIDSIAQSWSVISGAADRTRAREAMNGLWQHLVRPEDKIALLLTPPFDHMQPNPGYIQGYPPGVRENGGQYTHAGCWALIALAQMGERQKAFELFQLLNPINHSLDSAAAERYRVEPYVVAADIYSVDPHRGRGGWTWYTGSAAWLYRSALETILGVQRKGEDVVIAPLVPDSWNEFSVTLRVGKTTYVLEMHRSGRSEAKPEETATALTAPARIRLDDDGGTHRYHIAFSAAVENTRPEEGELPKQTQRRLSVKAT